MDLRPLKGRSVVCSKDNVICWCMDEGLIACERVCGHCNKAMKLVV